MIYKTVLCIVLLIMTHCGISQVNLDLEGALQVQEGSDLQNPVPGTIRWTGSDLEGWNGIIWVSLTGSVLDTVSDINGNIYKTLKIGQAVWMIENLRTRNFNDGGFIGDITSDAGWTGATFAARCRYGNNNSSIIPYGYLYNGYAVTDDRLCPTGWHVSTVQDWEDLINLSGGSSIAGGPLKQTGDEFWSLPNTGATNETGFSALPGGQRKTNGEYNNQRLFGNYWAIDLIGFLLKDYNIRYDQLSVGKLTITSNNWGFSVRCVKD